MFAEGERTACALLALAHVTPTMVGPFLSVFGCCPPREAPEDQRGSERQHVKFLGRRLSKSFQAAVTN
jgi:hypothetical protein